MPNLLIRRACLSDCGAVSALGAALFHAEADALFPEFTSLLQSEDAAIFLALDGAHAVAFAQCQLRHDYVEGAQSSPVAYLEGIYVSPGFRRAGLAASLLAACEGWARERDCREFASDCELDNEASAAFHAHMGFTEVNRIRCFLKPL